MRRPRWFICATRGGAPSPPWLPKVSVRPLSHYLKRFSTDGKLDTARGPDLVLDPDLEARFGLAFDRVDPEDPDALLSCVTHGYGKSLLRSGSYLRTEEGRLRRMSPQELLSLFGFPPSFSFPEGMTLRQRWQLIGNSLSVDCVARLLVGLVQGLC